MAQANWKACFEIMSHLLEVLFPVFAIARHKILTDYSFSWYQFESQQD